MNFRKNNIGKFTIQNQLKDGEGIRVLNKYLRELVIEIAKNSTSFIKKNEHPPFIYREKQFHTVMAPAIAKISNTFLMESPVIREWKVMNRDYIDSHGWVDYWCEYNNYNYYIELKHGFISYRSGKIRNRDKIEWNTAYEQLSVIDEEIKEQKEFTHGIFKIILHVLPIYIGSQSEINIKINNERLIEIQKTSMKLISEDIPSNWSCLWELHNRLINSSEYSYGIEKYPALLFLANVSEIEKAE